ncbi:MAG: helix-turn-helix domain-containing protein [Clostridiales bacterium]|jgi:excisionase family DNA binding protein|nr:helix-turn-helix domain-containing protein [Clostridiales bacterium]
MQEINNTQIDSISENRDSFISVDEMARMLSIARITAYQLTKIKDFPCFYIGKRIIIPLQAFHRWAEDQASRQATLATR